MKPPFEYKQMVLSRDSFGAASNGSVLAEAEERAAAEVAYSGECFPRTQLGSPETCVCVCVCCAHAGGPLESLLMSLTRACERLRSPR